MTYLNTIEVGETVPNILGAQTGDVDSSYQNGLMGQGPSMAGLREEDFDRKHNRKISISQAIEEDDGKKIPSKGRKRRYNAKKGANADKLNIDEGSANESWDSSRGRAKVVDLSNKTGAPHTKLGGKHLDLPEYYKNGPESYHKKAASKKGSSQNGSAVNIDVE